MKQSSISFKVQKKKPRAKRPLLSHSSKEPVVAPARLLQSRLSFHWNREVKRVHKEASPDIDEPTSSVVIVDVDDTCWEEVRQELISSKKICDITIRSPDDNAVTLILRGFDLNPEYGPCIGATRAARWERAQDMSLNPPVEVRDLLNSQIGSSGGKHEYSVFEHL